MKMHTKVGIPIAAIAAALFLTTGVASAADTSVACSVSGYTANNRITYSVSGSDWLISYISYMFSPNNSLSTHNNVNEVIYNSSGTATYAWNSPDSLLRTGNWYVLQTFGTPLVLSAGQKMVFTNIVDVPNDADPRCTATIQR